MVEIVFLLLLLLLLPLFQAFRSVHYDLCYIRCFHVFGVSENFIFQNKLHHTNLCICSSARMQYAVSKQYYNIWLKFTHCTKWNPECIHTCGSRGIKPDHMCDYRVWKMEIGLWIFHSGKSWQLSFEIRNGDNGRAGDWNRFCIPFHTVYCKPCTAKHFLLLPLLLLFILLFPSDEMHSNQMIP